MASHVAVAGEEGVSAAIAAAAAAAAAAVTTVSDGCSSLQQQGRTPAATSTPAVTTAADTQSDLQAAAVAYLDRRPAPYMHRIALEFGVKPWKLRLQIAKEVSARIRREAQMQTLSGLWRRAQLLGAALRAEQSPVSGTAVDSIQQPQATDTPSQGDTSKVWDG